MKCDKVRELMSLYIDDELRGIDRVEFEMHLKECPECLEETRILTSLVRECNEIEEVELPENFGVQLRAKLLEAAAEDRSKEDNTYTFPLANKITKRIFSLNWKVASGLAAVLLIAIIGISSLNNLGMTTKNLGYLNPKSRNNEMANDMTTEGYGGTIRGNVAQRDSAPAPAPMAPSFTSSELKKSEDVTLTGEGTITANEQYSEPQNRERKIIKTAYVNLEVENYQEIVTTLTNHLLGQGGYIQYSSESNIQEYFEGRESTRKVGNYTIRIPYQFFESSLMFIEGLGDLKDRSIGGQDVTYAYYDIETKVKNLVVQEERIRDIMTKAEKVEELIMLERELNRIRTDIEGYMSTLKGWDDQVQYSTINLGLREKKPLERKIEPVDANLWQRTKGAFVQTVNSIIKTTERMVVLVGGLLPIAIILTLFLLAIVIWIKRRKKI